jgi:uncharacterized membrane protein
MSIIDSAVQLTAPWAQLYRDSKLVSTGVLFGHLGGLLLGGGFAIAADRATLRMARGAGTVVRRIHLHELRAVHRPVVLGMSVTLVSGLLLLAANVEAFLPSPLFWLKMGLITVLLGNGVQLARTEASLRNHSEHPRRMWRRLRNGAKTSLFLWFGSLLLGTALLAV